MISSKRFPLLKNARPIFKKLGEKYGKTPARVFGLRSDHVAFDRANNEIRMSEKGTAQTSDPFFTLGFKNDVALRTAYRFRRPRPTWFQVRCLH